MSTVVVRYQTKPDRGDENQALVEKVFTQLAAADPGGVRYMTLRLDDGVTFVHVAEVDGDGPNPLGELSAFADFQADIVERCDVPPDPQPATIVGSYRFRD